MWDFLSPKQWRQTMLTCKLVLQSLQLKQEWLAALGYKLLKQPEGFSPAALLSHLLQDPAFRCACTQAALRVFSHCFRAPLIHRAHLYHKRSASPEARESFEIRSPIY